MASTFCGHCGAELPAGTIRAAPLPDSTEPATARGELAVGGALVGMALALTLAVALVVVGSRGSKPMLVPPHAMVIGHRAAAASSPLVATTRPARPAPTAAVAAGPYQLAYPKAWSVAAANRAMPGYQETVLHSSDGLQRVTVDRVPGERLDPAAKAAQVEAATSRTPGYQRLAFRRTTVGGRPAFEWVFTLAGSNFNRRADLFVNTGRDGFAFLAHGADLGHAIATARAIAASLRPRA